MSQYNRAEEINASPLEVQELGWPPRLYPYSAGIVGGFLGGLVMTIPAIAYGMISGYGPWLPVNLVALTVLPGGESMTLQQIAQFNPLALVVGLTIHLTLATLLGLLFAMLLPTLPGNPTLWSLVIGPVLWLGATVIVLPQINPVMSRMLDWPSFLLANIAYGLVLGFWVSCTERVPADCVHHPKIYLPSFLR